MGRREGQRVGGEREKKKGEHQMRQLRLHPPRYLLLAQPINEHGANIQDGLYQRAKLPFSQNRVRNSVNRSHCTHYLEPRATQGYLNRYVIHVKPTT